MVTQALGHVSSLHSTAGGKKLSVLGLTETKNHHAYNCVNKGQTVFDSS